MASVLHWVVVWNEMWSTLHILLLPLATHNSSKIRNVSEKTNTRLLFFLRRIPTKTKADKGCLYRRAENTGENNQEQKWQRDTGDKAMSNRNMQGVHWNNTGNRKTTDDERKQASLTTVDLNLGRTVKDDTWSTCICYWLILDPYWGATAKVNCTVWDTGHDSAMDKNRNSGSDWEHDWNSFSRLQC